MQQFLVLLEAFLWSAIAEPLARPVVEEWWDLRMGPPINAEPLGGANGAMRVWQSIAAGPTIDPAAVGRVRC